MSLILILSKSIHVAWYSLRKSFPLTLNKNVLNSWHSQKKTLILILTKNVSAKRQSLRKTFILDIHYVCLDFLLGVYSISISVILCSRHFSHWWLYLHGSSHLKHRHFLKTSSLAWHLCLVIHHSLHTQHFFFPLLSFEFS